MGKFITGFMLGLLAGLITLFAISYYVKGDWVEFKLIVLEFKDLLYEQLSYNFRFVLFLIFVTVGAIIAYLLGGIVDIHNYKKKKEAELEEKYNKRKAEIKEAEKKAIKSLQKIERKAEGLVKEAGKEAYRIVKKAKEEAEKIKKDASIKGYEEGQQRHKKELKILRTRLSAIRNIFKAYPELNECFKKITGWDFEKWLKER